MDVDKSDQRNVFSSDKLPRFTQSMTNDMEPIRHIPYEEVAGPVCTKLRSGKELLSVMYSRHDITQPRQAMPNADEARSDRKKDRKDTTNP